MCIYVQTGEVFIFTAYAYLVHVCFCIVQYVKEEGGRWLWLCCPCFPWLVDMNQGSQAPIIHEELFKGN